MGLIHQSQGGDVGIIHEESYIFRTASRAVRINWDYYLTACHGNIINHDIQDSFRIEPAATIIGHILQSQQLQQLRATYQLKNINITKRMIYPVNSILNDNHSNTIAINHSIDTEIAIGI